MQEISICRSGGEISGYVVDAREENLGNYLEEHTSLSGIIVNTLRKSSKTVALIKNLMVVSELRGQGIGSDLVCEFLSEAHSLGASCVVLIADAYEIQGNNLDLAEWYGQFGFENILDTAGGPFMVMGDDIAPALLRSLSANDELTPSP